MVVGERGDGHHRAGAAGRTARTTPPTCAGARRAPRRATRRDANPRLHRRASSGRLGEIAGTIMRVNSPRWSAKSTRRAVVVDLGAGVGQTVDRGSRGCPPYSASTGDAGSSSQVPTRKSASASASHDGSSSRHASAPLGLGPGEHAEEQVEVVGAARDRAEHVDVGVGAYPRRRGRGTRAAGSRRSSASGRRRRSSATGCAPSRRCRCPTSKLVKPAATAAAAPPDEPPADAIERTTGCW